MGGAGRSWLLVLAFCRPAVPENTVLSVCKSLVKPAVCPFLDGAATVAEAAASCRADKSSIPSDCDQMAAVPYGYFDKDRLSCQEPCNMISDPLQAHGECLKRDIKAAYCDALLTPGLWCVEQAVLVCERDTIPDTRPCTELLGLSAVVSNHCQKICDAAKVSPQLRHQKLSGYVVQERCQRYAAAEACLFLNSAGVVTVAQAADKCQTGLESGKHHLCLDLAKVPVWWLLDDMPCGETCGRIAGSEPPYTHSTEIADCQSRGWDLNVCMELEGTWCVEAAVASCIRKNHRACHDLQKLPSIKNSPVAKCSETGPSAQECQTMRWVVENDGDSRRCGFREASSPAKGYSTLRDCCQDHFDPSETFRSCLAQEWIPLDKSVLRCRSATLAALVATGSERLSSSVTLDTDCCKAHSIGCTGDRYVCFDDSDAEPWAPAQAEWCCRVKDDCGRAQAKAGGCMPTEDPAPEYVLKCCVSGQCGLFNSFAWNDAVSGKEKDSDAVMAAFIEKSEELGSYDELTTQELIVRIGVDPNTLRWNPVHCLGVVRRGLIAMAPSTVAPGALVVSRIGVLGDDGTVPDLKAESNDTEAPVVFFDSAYNALGLEGERRAGIGEAARRQAAPLRAEIPRNRSLVAKVRIIARSGNEVDAMQKDLEEVTAQEAEDVNYRDAEILSRADAQQYVPTNDDDMSLYHIPLFVLLGAAVAAALVFAFVKLQVYSTGGRFSSVKDTPNVDLATGNLSPLVNAATPTVRDPISESAQTNTPMTMTTTAGTTATSRFLMF